MSLWRFTRDFIAVVVSQITKRAHSAPKISARFGISAHNHFQIGQLWKARQN
jgi:hypothetical protein